MCVLKIVSFMVVFRLLLVSAHAEDLGQIPLTQAHFRATFEQVTLPQNEKMGLLGYSLLYDVNANFSAGLAAYGALTGERGGFITLGLATELRQDWDAFGVNGGLFVGGGGGRGGYTIQGGGLMVRTHLGLQSQFEQLGTVGLGLSYEEFPNGNIHSLQPYISYEYPFTALFVSGWPDIAGENSQVSADYPSSESEFSLVYQTYTVPANTYEDNGIKLQFPEINLIGVEWRRYLDERRFVKIESEGAMGGHSRGYMQILMGGGYRMGITDSTAAILAADFGVAGGGNVATGGGLLLDASASIQQNITKDLFLELGGGYATAPDGDFTATSWHAKMGYQFAMPYSSEPFIDPQALAGYEQHHMRLRMVHQTYMQNDPKWRNHHADLSLYVFGFQSDYFIADDVYLTGQGIAAYKGQGGGYMTGLVGAGVQHNLFQTPVFVSLEMLMGAAGGGGLDLGGGLVWQSTLELGYQLSEAHRLVGSYGQMQAFKGNFKANVVGASLSYDFTFFAN